ncbi:RraA family protein [Kordiimonas pumila]|uniref:Putative 4-hydroxy-4-methyl-2-oxoglutarate aldolase n=1 Tax=Kordiimonas pumila TaxID=2161677 RepID=A0ABV7D495_9PROT|nr:RraA family protein [Kordiimonas pumila]
MFDVHKMPEQISPSLVELLQQVETATVGHFLHTGFIDRDIRAVLPEARVAGTAVTVRIPHADSTALHYLLKTVRPGDFVVVERCGDSRHACWGGVVTHAMKRAGIVGAVIDGPATDFAEIRSLGLPVWCRGPSSITTKLLGLDGAINVPVTVGGQIVHPGDAILADESGVIALSKADAIMVANTALDMQQREIEVLARLYGGECLPDITGATQMVEKSA